MYQKNKQIGWFDEYLKNKILKEVIVFAKYKKWYRQNSTKALKFVGQNGTLFKSKGNILPQNVSFKRRKNYLRK